MKLYRNILRNIKQNLTKNLKNDEISTMVKNGKLSIQDFENHEEEEINNLTKSLIFIKEDRHGQKHDKYHLSSVIRSDKRNFERK